MSRRISSLLLLSALLVLGTLGVGARARAEALLGGVSADGVRPGEFSLAHGGVLLADEIAEWGRDAREAFREPLERGFVTLTRAQGRVELPARFILAAAANPCPCGGWPSEIRAPTHVSPATRCRCSARDVRGYLARLSGPILDRIDLVSAIGSLRAAERVELRRYEGPAKKARSLLLMGWGSVPGEWDATQTERAITSLGKRVPVLEGSLRSRHKIARVAFTAAALDGLPEPGPQHWSEATRARWEYWVG